MQTELSSEFKNTPQGDSADAILRKCVHCGFCNATCPTYQLLGDELDGPRGRIYLIKQVFEGRDVTRSTQLHLDRCLTCRNCETTCPSGVEFGRLVELGREAVDQRVRRPARERVLRWLLREGMTSPLFALAARIGRRVRPLLPAVLAAKLPPGAARRDSGAVSEPAAAGGAQPRSVLMLAGCVQPSLMPNIDAATIRVLAAAGIRGVFAAGAGCCGALRTHLSDREGGLDDMRRNVDAWWPLVSSGAVDAIVINASACSLAVKEYGHSLAGDAGYAAKASKISSLALDLSELLPQMVPLLKSKLRAGTSHALAFHPPCTLQHGQQLRGGTELHLRALGFAVRAAAGESHLCCGSAGTYSLLQPTLARQLRDRKLANLLMLDPVTIVSANIGCIMHLQSGTGIPVRHWVEVLDAALGGG
jgi:glycolate oxidase iron-sulfur subunit